MAFFATAARRRKSPSWRCSFNRAVSFPLYCISFVWLVCCYELICVSVWCMHGQYVFTYACMHVCMYACMYVCMCVFMYMCMLVCMCASVSCSLILFCAARVDGASSCVRRVLQEAGRQIASATCQLFLLFCVQMKFFVFVCWSAGLGHHVFEKLQLFCAKNAIDVGTWTLCIY